MAQEDDLRALGKIMDFLRAVSIILAIMNVYWYCYEAMRMWGVTIGVVDRILINFNRTGGLFHSILYTKLFSLLLLALSCLGTKGVKAEKMSWNRIWTVLAVGFFLFFLNWWILLLPISNLGNATLYIFTMTAGYICLLMGGLWMSRLLKHNLMEDVFNNENESFMQETKLMENEYSVNLPTRFYYKKKWQRGWINVVNPFRATIVLGTPGSGKSFAVVNNYIKQQIEKGYSMYIYDFKFSDLSTIAYNHMMNHQNGYKVKPQFYVINFDDPRRSHRCNPIHPDFMSDISGPEAGRLLCGESDNPLCCHHMVPKNLQERKVLYLSPCHRIAQPQIRGCLSDTDELSRIRELSFTIHGRLARWGDGAVGGSDCQRKDSVVTNDLTTTLLGDVRKRVYTRHQQSRRTEDSMCRQQSRPSEHLWCGTWLVQQPHSETHQQEGTTQIIRYH